MFRKLETYIMRKILIIFLAAFVFTSCDNLKAKSEDEKESVKMKKSLDDEEEDEEATPKKKKKKQVEEDSDDYVSEDENETESDNSSNYRKGWSDAEKDNFVNTCVSKATSSMGEKLATNYCNCMLEKIETLFPDPNQAGDLSETKMTQMARECLN